MSHAETFRPKVQPSCLGFYEQELDYLYEVLRRLGLRSPEIDDLAQEVFIVLQRKWPTLDVTQSLRPYLFGIAFRLACAHRRRKTREIPFATLEAEDEDAGPEQAFDSAQSAQLLMTALGRLPLKRRAVVVMYELDGCSMDEVAARLSISRFGAYSRLRKARQELAAAMRRLTKER